MFQPRHVDTIGAARQSQQQKVERTAPQGLGAGITMVQ
jgi:hypothetical protein